MIENNAVSYCFSARAALLKTWAVNGMGELLTSACCVLFNLFLWECFLYLNILKLKLSLNPYRGPKSKARAIERNKEELLFSCINF